MVAEQITPRTELVFDSATRVGESPVWDARDGSLSWVDISAGAVFRGEPGTGHFTVSSLGGKVGSLALCRSGGLLVAQDLKLMLLDAHGGARVLAGLGELPDTLRFNDGKAGPDGRFWVGTMDQRPERSAVASLYRFGSDGLADQLQPCIVSNGLAFSPDARWLYHSDSGAKAVWRYAFDVASGTLGPREVWLDWQPQLGSPDGAAMDAEGHYWSCGIRAGAIHRFAPDGRHLASYRMPISQPTMCCFGGRDMRTLFVTSMRAGLDDDRLAAEPLTGNVIAFRVDTPGAPVPVLAAW